MRQEHYRIYCLYLLAAKEKFERPAVPGRGFAAAIGAAALCGAFVLPFLAPGSRQVYSAAYAAGSNNKLATIALALLAVATLSWTWLPRRKPSAPPDDGPRLSGMTVALGALLVLLWTAGLGAAITHLHLRYGESAYFLERSRDVLQFSPALYRDLEFPYGPLLLLPPVWLARALHLGLGPGLDACYWTWLTLLNVAGILLAAYILNRLPLGRSARWVLFALCCFEQMHPLLGPNYSLGKFLLPLAVLVWGTRLRGPARQAAGLAAGHLLTVLVSPELGVGLAAGIAGWAALTAWRERSLPPLLSWLAPVAGYGVFLAIYGRGFLDRLANASAGALNLVLEPLPHLYILLVALVWLAPVAVALALHNRSRQAPLLAGLFLLSLGLLPGALGRADPLHVYFNSWGLLTLSAVGLERLGRTRATLWLAALVLLGIQTQATSFRIYKQPLLDLVHRKRTPADLDPAQLKTATAGAPIAAPVLLGLPLADELALRQAGLLPLDYEAGLADLWDATGERAKIARLRRFDWALIPGVPYVQEEGSPNDAHLKVLLRLGYRYPQRRVPYKVGALLEQELATHWTVAQRFPSTVLLRRVH